MGIIIKSQEKYLFEGRSTFSLMYNLQVLVVRQTCVFTTFLCKDLKSNLANLGINTFHKFGLFFRKIELTVKNMAEG